MGRILGHIVAVTAVLLCSCACSQKARVIPEKQLEDLYIDMFIADQWLRDHNDFQLAADTSLFFDPIFAEHGYSFEDYDATLKYYTARPEVLSADLTIGVCSSCSLGAVRKSVVSAKNEGVVPLVATSLPASLIPHEVSK